jgi:hypothetical protein
MMDKREKQMEVVNSKAFAIVEYDTAESRNEARHRFLEYFGTKVHCKFKDRVEKDPNNSRMYNQLKQCLGKKPRKIVLFDKKTKKVKKTPKGYIKSVIAKDKNKKIILDPILPLELTARCRVKDVSDMRQLHIRGLQSGSSGYQIGQLLGNIIAPHCNTGPITDLNGDIGSISSRGRCNVWFPDHTTAQQAFDAINNSADDDSKTRVRAFWAPPRRQPTKLEVKFRKRIYNAIQHFDKTGMAGSGLEKVLEEGKSLSPGGVLGTKSFMEEGGAAEEEIRP